MKANIYKVELLIVDLEQYPEDELLSTLPGHVKSVKKVEVDWSDDHPLNKPETCESEYERLFSKD